MSNVKIITAHASRYLKENYNNITVKEEFGMFLNVRTDLLGIDDKNIISVEVKSDKDTFAKLENQLDGYATFITGIYVALDEVHYEK